MVAGRKNRFVARGRQAEPAAVDEVRALLSDADLRRDRLIENLHRIQDRFGHLSARHLAALADLMRLALTEIYEVATFYAHFEVVKEGDAAPPPLTVRVCEGLPCRMAGSEELHHALVEALGDDVRVVGAPCVGACDHAPVAVVGKRRFGDAVVETVAAAVAAGETAPQLPPVTDFEAYRAGGGYDLLQSLVAGERDCQDVVAAVAGADLRGLGGAGFPTARKWGFLAFSPKPRALVINADEGEPGTFKDLHCLSTDLHRVLEGALIAAWVVEAEDIYFYLRDEYPDILAVLAGELAKVEAAGLTAGRRVHVRRGAGAYICGEESALMESIEGKRGLPRNRPPYPAEKGLFGRPTLIHNVETLYHLRAILTDGPEAFAAHRTRLYSVSGRVRRPGVVRAPATVTARQLIDDHCGGMAPGHRFAAYLPGGASGGILPARLADLPLDFGTLEPYGCFTGSGAVIVLSDRDDLRGAVLNLLRFFEDESCGQCTPCRQGTAKLVHLLERPQWDRELIEELSRTMRDASICGLGQAAPNPVLSLLHHMGEKMP